MYRTMYEMAATATRGNRLSRARVSQAALGIVDRDGLDALTMRRLAGELGAPTMTLYGYVRDKDDLLEAVVEAAAERHWQEPRPGPWQERLKAVARELHGGLLEHPSLVQLRLRRPIVSASALRGTEVAMQALWRPASSSTRPPVPSAWSSSTCSAAPPSTSRRCRTGSPEVRAVAVSLPPEEYPIVSQAGAEMAATLGGEEQFELGLDAVVAGIEARL